jgi:thiol-disulfide isomerase/thioredoxin
MSTKALIGILLAGTVGILIFLFVHLSGDSNTVSIGSKEATACSKGGDDCLPDVNYVDTTGHAHTFQALKGKVVIVNFWATWCGPCKTEVPWFVEFADKYKAQGLTVLGVSVDDSPEDIKKFSAEYKVNYPMLVGLGRDDVAKAYDALMAIPVTWLIRADGTVHTKVTGIHGKDWFEQQIQELF